MDVVRSDLWLKRPLLAMMFFAAALSAAILICSVSTEFSVAASKKSHSKHKKKSRQKCKLSRKASTKGNQASKKRHRKKGKKSKRRHCRKKGGGGGAGPSFPLDDPYDIGNPVVFDIWVNPVSGSDSNSGNSRSEALRTMHEAWSKVPSGATLTGHGYRFMITPGRLNEGDMVNYWDDRHGTYQFPVIIQAADGNGTVSLSSMNVFNVSYLYLLGVNLEDSHDVFHCEQCDHLLIRDAKVQSSNIDDTRETIKVNQSQYIFIESSDISGANDNAVDWVGVQYGHLLSNKIHNAQDWCAYSKGGSAYVRVASNEIYDCGTGGYTAGQGSGFQWMTPPWIHYEAYDVKVYNNIIHDTVGAGLGVNGGYNILMAYNTLYRVGSRSHAVEFVFGERSCDGPSGEPTRSRCSQYLAQGGWGNAAVDCSGDCTRIPNRNVFFYNNIIFNPPGFQSQWQHFAVAGPYSGSGQTGSNAPNPALADQGLRIRGNMIWNGPFDLDLGVGGDSGCSNTNTTCNASQLIQDNSINSILPQLVNPAAGDYSPVAAGSVDGATTYSIPDFIWSDAPQAPEVPSGKLSNEIPKNISGSTRQLPGRPGAY